MRGEEIKLVVPVEDGKDALGDIVWRDEEITVQNVLVAPGSSSDISDSTRPDGVEVRYTLYFPKTFDMRLDNSRACIRGEWLHIVGAPRRYDRENCPTEWWMVAEAGGSHG